MKRPFPYFVKVLYTLLLIILFGACSSSHRPVEELLEKAESMIWTQPDSSLVLLESIRTPHELTGKEQVDYALLLSQAMYRCFKPAPSDSLINVAVSYYRQKGGADKAGLSLYLKGGIWRDDLKDRSKAVLAYKEAESYIPQMKDKRVVGRIYTDLAYINKEDGNFQLAGHYYQKAYSIHQQENDTVMMASNVVNLTTVYLVSHQPDSVNWCMDRMREFVSAVGDTTLIHDMYLNMGTVYKYSGQYRQAENMFCKAWSLKPHNPSLKVLVNLASLYHETGQAEKSDSLFKQLVELPDVFVRSSAYYTLIQHSLASHSPELLEQFHHYSTTMDQAYRQLNASQLTELQYKYDKELLQNHNYRLYNQWLTTLCIIFFLVILFPVVLRIYHHYRKKQIARLQEYIHQLEELSLEETNRERMEELESEIARLTQKEQKLMEQLKYKSSDIRTQYFQTYLSLIKDKSYSPSSDRHLLAGWLNFSMNGFSDKLAARLPMLKNRLLDVCYLSALDFTVKDMASILQVNESSVRRYMSLVCKEAGLAVGGKEEFKQLIDKIKGE